MSKLSVLFILLLFLVPVVVAGQEYRADSIMQWPDSLNTAKDVQYLTEEEKAVIFEMNKVRTNPKAYAVYLKREKAFYDGAKVKKPGLVILLTDEGVAAVDECIAYLENAAPCPMLYPDEVLGKVAEELAKEQSALGSTGHDGKSGGDFADRMKRHNRRAFRALGENISYGRDKAFDIVFQLLVDDGVPTRGHRINMMNTDYEFCGVAIETHPQYGYVCIIDYASFFKKK